MAYIPSIEDIVFAKKINDDVIWQQTLNRELLMEAFLRLFGHKAETQQHARRAIFAWFQYTFKPEMLVPPTIEDLDNLFTCADADDEEDELLNMDDDKFFTSAEIAEIAEEVKNENEMERYSSPSIGTIQNRDSQSHTEDDTLNRQSLEDSDLKSPTPKTRRARTNKKKL